MRPCTLNLSESYEGQNEDTKIVTAKKKNVLSKQAISYWEFED